MYKKGQKISGSLKIICKDFIKYDDKEDMINKLGNLLTTKKGF